MKIIYLLNARIPTEKAHGYQSLKTSESLMKNGAEVEVWIPGRKITNKLSKESLMEYYHLRLEVPVKKFFGVDFLYLADRLPNSFAAKVKIKHFAALANSSVYYMLSMLRMAFSRKEDIFYTRDHNLVRLASYFYRGSLEKRFVLEVHSLPSSRQKKERYAVICNSCESIITITHALKERLLELGVDSKKIMVEPDSVDLDLFDIKKSLTEARVDLNLDANAIIASFVGNFHTINNEKGIPEIIMSAAALLEKHKDLVFYFVGGPLDRVKDYEEIIKQHHIPTNRMFFLDRQPVSEIPTWLKASNLLLMPHPFTEFYAYYVSPMKMFEYMSSGRPIVASSLPSILEILTHNKTALLCNPGDVHDLQRNINLLLQDPTLAKKIARNALQKVRKFTWEKRARRIISFIEKGEARKCGS